MIDSMGWELCDNVLNLYLRCNDCKGKEEADKRQVDGQPRSIGQLQGASFRMGSAEENESKS